MVDKRIVIARVFSHYTGPSNYYLYDRMRLLPPDRYETICIYLKRVSDEPNNQEKHFKCYYLSGSKSSPLKWWRLSRILKRENVDIVHANRHSATVQSTMAALLADTPAVVSHVHGMSRCRNWRRKLWYRLFSFKIKKAIAISKGVAVDISENFPGLQNKAELVYNSIDYNRFHDAPEQRNELRDEFGIPRDAFVFVFAARLVPTKGHDLLLHSFAKVLKSHENTYLLLAGDGVLKGELQELSRTLKIEKNVLFPGYRSDMPELLKACDAFVMSSVKEGFGLCLVEAMAAGLPVVATGEGGVGEVLESAGLYVPERTDNALSDGMLKVYNLSTNERAEWIAKADSKALEHYTHMKAVERLVEVYNMCIDKG